MRRARHPSFGPTEEAALLEELRTVRRRAIMCGAAAGFNSPRHQVTSDLADAIDAMAEELTGKREYFWDVGSTGRSRG